MKNGLMKVLILRIIRDNPGISGYGIIGEIERITGRRPSTGTIYPMLMDMTERGWISKEKGKKGSRYSITPEGEEKFQEFRSLKREYMEKVFERFSIAVEGFDAPKDDIFMLIAPIIMRVHRMVQAGIDEDVLKEILEETVRKLDEVMEEWNM